MSPGCECGMGSSSPLWNSAEFTNVVALFDKNMGPGDPGLYFLSVSL